MKLLLIGHRGIGKTSLLQRLREYYPSHTDQMLCLDQEIEKKLGQTIKQHCEEQGEESFRNIEQQVLQELTSRLSGTVVIAVGAGYQGPWPEGWQKLWLQRSVDSKAALFLDRPALGDGLRMPADRFEHREKLYAQMADFRLLLSEHVNEHEPNEKQFFAPFLSSDKLPRRTLSMTYLTLFPHHQKNNFRSLKSLLEVADFPVEWRDDLLSEEALETLINEKMTSVLMSFRDPQRQQMTRRWIERVDLWDWPLEWEPCSFAEPPVLSLHQRTGNLQQVIKQLPQGKSHLKLAVPIENFAELTFGLSWQQEDPDNRSFLPNWKSERSGGDQGRWQWFRLWQRTRQKLNYFREGLSPHLDQPSFLQLLAWQDSLQKVAGVLGDPVSQSLTPSYHRKFFQSRGANTVAIPVETGEWSEALPLLHKIDLTAAAVTSPLKGLAGKLVESDIPINTLVWSKDHWQGTNTDDHGFRELAKGFSQKRAVIWGGGGVLKSLESQFTSTVEYSSRTGEPRQPGEACDNPEVIAWAVGAKNFAKQGTMPPGHWRPEVVIDLNYTDDSPGKACAAFFDCQYISGLRMFEAQANVQQEYWNQYVGQ